MSSRWATCHVGLSFIRVHLRVARVVGTSFLSSWRDRRRPRRHREYGLEYGLAYASRSHSPSVGADEYVCFGSKRWPSTTADATSTSFRFVVRACSRSILK